MIDVDELAEKIVAQLSMVRPEWLSPADAAVYCGLAEKTLEALRSSGDGPVWAKYGRRVLYRRESLDAYLSSLQVRQDQEGEEWETP